MDESTDGTMGRLPVMPTKVGIHDYGAVRKQGVDGGPSPAMTGSAWSVPRLMQ